jgi:hypothetical protein
MRRSLKGVIGTVVLLTAGHAHAQSYTTATTSATASATILQPITLVKSTDLAFGSMVRPSTGSNVITVSELTGVRSLTGGGDAALGAATNTRATYSVGGDGGATFSVTIPPSVTLVRSGGTETLPVTLASSAGTGTLSAGTTGTANFGVGGSLPLSTTTVPGSYSGTFNVTVGYN